MVCSANSGKVVSFIQEQVNVLIDKGLIVDYFLVQQKGLLGYLHSRKALLRKINEFSPDIIHAHYGLSGLFANLQRKVPVVTTYHGSDINQPKARKFSCISIRLSQFNIFVSQKLIEIVKPKKHFLYLPCGVDLSLFVPMDKADVRGKLGLDIERKYVLFSSSFSNMVKNYPLAKAAVELLEDVELLELKGYSREQVVLLMNAVDCVLMTSFTEGSPQFIKEAMACNTPIVSTKVGEVPLLIDGIEGCYLAETDARKLAKDIQSALIYGRKTNARERLLDYDNQLVGDKLIEIYKTVVK